MSEEKKENVETYLKELRSVIEYPDDLTYTDIMDKMQLAYKVASIYSEQNDNMPESVKVKRSEELSKIMTELGKLAKIKSNADKIEVNDPSSSVSKTNKKDKSEKKIPKPVFDEPEIAEAKVESAVSSTEPTQEQIDSVINVQQQQSKPNLTVNNLNLFANLSNEKPKSEEVAVGHYEDAVVVSVNTGDPKVINDKSDVSPIEKNEKIEETKPEIPLAAIPTLPPKASEVVSEEEKTDMELDAPSIEQQIIVSDDGDTKKEDELDSDSDSLDYSFLDTNKPFEGDDDIDSDEDVDLTNVIF